ncbi:MAG: pyruvate ferredoxin oxidoreductase [Deltaproteobacteria bacterium]|jgi:pyruvate ferredoxin oxidoreductase alpha subunit|nr:pyruvate ferredoxin oxidoreductase [Deltaproteobacteria bacterium]
MATKPIGLEVSIAVAEAVKLCDVDVVAAYPITPQTHIVEHLSELVADGELNASYVPVESEHSAMSSCIGSSATGARTFTATSSQGLALMNEMIYIAPTLRTPIVLAIANRALSAPINIWNDHSDIMSVRDAGWIAVFAENGQEALDLTIMSFRIGEHPEVLLPVSLNIDGFTLSHFIEPIIMPEKSEVDAFLPPFKTDLKLDTQKPLSIGLLAGPETYTEIRKATDDILVRSKKYIKEVFAEFGKAFGRPYNVVETYRHEDAEIILLTMGSISETAMTSVDELREAGQKVGLVRIRLWRPFPVEELKEALGQAKIVAVVDRHLVMGATDGPVSFEIKSLFYGAPKAPKVFNFILGLGGRDVRRADFKEIVQRCAELDKVGQKSFEIVGVYE